jgi:hypothetical protein
MRLRNSELICLPKRRGKGKSIKSKKRGGGGRKGDLGLIVEGIIPFADLERIQKVL